MQNNTVDFHIYLDYPTDSYCLTVTKTIYVKHGSKFGGSPKDSVEFFSKPQVDERKFFITYESLMKEFGNYQAVAPYYGDNFKKEPEKFLIRMFYKAFIAEEYKNDALVIYEFKKFESECLNGNVKIGNQPKGEEIQTFNNVGYTFDNSSVQIKFIVKGGEEFAAQLAAYKQALESKSKGQIAWTGDFYYVEESKDNPSMLSKRLPGVNEIVKHPKTSTYSDSYGCYYDNIPMDEHGTDTFSVRTLVMHLNDEHRWTREQIADWLDTLDVDLSFKIKENEDEVSN